MKVYEIRDPIHGFVKINDWERDIINHSAFQRLRRIKQLAWTDMVYPGASHSRFEHSLGVMHVVTKLVEAITERQKEYLLCHLRYVDGSLERIKTVLRLAALLHDVGHAPFSHAAEEIFPVRPDGEDAFQHEEYSAAIVEHQLADVIENHPANHFRIKAKDITAFFLGNNTDRDCQIWGDLLSSQLDGDRMDYLLRDSYHAGVNYGKYDLNRVAATVRLIQRPNSDEYTLGIDEDGIHAAEGLILARYMMFTQLYFHKTRVIYDYHLVEALKAILEPRGGLFPPPTSAQEIGEYLKWDDWKVSGEIAVGNAGSHGEILKNRNHYRMLCSSAEVPDINELERFDKLEQEFAGMGGIRKSAGKSWYKFKKLDDEILVQLSSSGNLSKVVPLSQRSPVVKGLEAVNQSRIYVPSEKREEAMDILKKMEGGGTK